MTISGIIPKKTPNGVVPIQHIKILISLNFVDYWKLAFGMRIY